MSKIITSPVEKFPGTVTLSNPLTFPQFLAVQDAVLGIQALRDEPDGDTLTQERINFMYLPGLIGCVEEWRLENFPEEVTEDTFPVTPGVASNELIVWLLSEIISLYNEAEEVPNA